MVDTPLRDGAIERAHPGCESKDRMWNVTRFEVVIFTDFMLHLLKFFLAIDVAFITQNDMEPGKFHLGNEQVILDDSIMEEYVTSNEL